jgi:hypothetical protein
MSGLGGFGARFAAGERVEVWRVLVAAGLTRPERHVVRQRLAGRSYAAIALDRAMRKADGSGYTRQRVQQTERDAMQRLGLGVSLEAAIHASERAERAEAMAARRGLVSSAELHGEAEPRRRLGAPRWEWEHEAAVEAFLEAAGV